nr:hypothetical transcript [Hymenolepis microstoma]
MSEENSWRTSLPSSSTGTGDQTVVRPDSLTIGSTAISMDILTPQLLQFIQSCQNTAGSATSTPDNKVLDSNTKNPVFVSPGHLVTLETAVEMTTLLDLSNFRPQTSSRRQIKSRSQIKYRS